MLELIVEAAPQEDPVELLGRVVALPEGEFEEALQSLPPELQAAAIEIREEQKQARMRQLSDLIRALENDKLNPIVRAKRPIDARMAEDDRQYYGLDRRPAPSADRIGVPSSGPGTVDDAIPPALNLTGPRTNTWTARVVNMACPGSILPGEIMPTPKPDMGPEAQQLGMAPESTDAEIDAAAHLAATKMNRTIKDQFAECKLPREVRKASAHLTRLGTGILAGPFQTKPKRVRFKVVEGGDGSLYEAVPDVAVKPTYRCVNPRYFFPEMVSDIADAGYCFELILATKRELTDWSTQEGFDQFKDQFAEILHKDYAPQIRGEIASNLTTWNSLSPNKEAIENRLAVWRYFGYIDSKDMAACGCDMPEEMEGEISAPQLVEIWFTDGRILRADTLIPEGTARLPYYVTPLFTVDDTMFGGGIPYAGRDAQASINALWRAAQHNAVVTAGPQIGYQDGYAVPTDGDYRVRGPKTWRITSEGKTIQDVLSQLIIGNNADQYIKLLEMRMQMFDEEINLPLIAQGQPDAATPTSSGLTMQMRAASVAILNVGQNCEDGWITPLFEAAYHYNMVYSKDPSIKGDFDCVSKLVSDSVMREIKAQHLLVLANMKKEDPDLALRVKPEVFYPRLATALEQDGDLFRTEAEVVKAQKNAPPPPPDPKVMQVELDRERLAAETEFKNRDRELDHTERMRELDIREKEAASRDYVATQMLQMKLIELADAKEMTVAQLQAKVGLDMEREKTKRGQIELSAEAKEREQGMRAQVEAEKLAQRDAENALEVQVEGNPGARLA